MGFDAATQRQLLATARDPSVGEAERQQALEQLLDDFRRPAMAAVMRVLHGVGVGSEHADEAWGRALFKFYTRGLAAFEGRANAPGRQAAAPRSYFVRLAINAAVDICRQLARSQRSAEPTVAGERARPAPGQSAAVATPAEQIEARQGALSELAQLEALRSCVEALPPRYGEPVVLYYLDQLGSCETCAARIGISKSSFMQRLSRARRKLADCVSARSREHQEGRHD
jgi:RNA polymerase sigma factor (sigma-70 family)